MKTFFNLIQEVQKPGRCHHCGGCVTFCTAINYGALELGEDGKPRYKDIEKCIECGLCYSICPEIGELDEETKRRVAWSAPMGRILETTVARPPTPIEAVATDGGVVTSLLLHLFDLGRIDGAIVTHTVARFSASPGWPLPGKRFSMPRASTRHLCRYEPLFRGLFYLSPSIVELEDVARRHLNRVAFVGTPSDQFPRRMEVLGIVPAGSIKSTWAFFARQFPLRPEQRRRLEEIGRFASGKVAKGQRQGRVDDPSPLRRGPPDSPG